MKARHGADHYITPQWAVHRLLEVLELERETMTICDPAAGNGELREAFYTWDKRAELPAITWKLNDIRPETTVPFHYDYLEATRGGLEWERVHLTLMNPPYIDALRFVKKALSHSQEVVALLRLSWLSSARRRDFLSVYKPDIFVLPDRPSFDGVDVYNQDFMWARWPHRGIGVHVLETTPLAIRKQDMERTRFLMLEANGQQRLPHVGRQS